MLQYDCVCFKERGGLFWLKARCESTVLWDCQKTLTKGFMKRSKISTLGSPRGRGTGQPSPWLLYTLPFWCIYLLLPLSLYLFLYAHLSCVSFPIFLFLFLMPLFCHFRGKLNILECIWGRAKTSGWRIKVGTQRWKLYKLKALGSGGGDVLRSKASCFQDYQSHTF